MSVTGEVQVGITVCLDSVVQAFRDGEAIIEKIKKKRAKKRAPPPPRLLEESINQAPWEIGREKKRGISRFGKAFEDGDAIAVIALQQITIELQQSLLDKLKNAAFDDDNKITDFMYLVDAADTGRDRTIAVLHELRQRLITAQSPQEAPSSQQAAPLTSASSSTSNATTPPPSADLQPDATPSPPQLEMPGSRTKAGITSDFVSSRDASGEEDAVSGAETTPKEHSRKSSLLGFLKSRHRTNSSTDAKIKVTSQPITEEDSSSSTMPFRPPPQFDASNPTDGASMPGRAQAGAPHFRYDDWQNHSDEIWSTRQSLDRHQSMAVAPDQQSDRTASTVNLSNPLQPPSPVLTNRTNSNPYNHLPSTAVPIPNPENEYLGLCKGAVKLQHGDRKGSFHKCKEVEAWSRHPSSHASAAQYLACQQQRCAFRSSFANKDTEVIWRRVFTLESKGMKVRWQFLAKSHVLQKVVVKHQYTFKCLFCIFLGRQSGVYHGMDYYLDHIASEHRGKPLNEVILYKTGCINDRVANEDDDFDINLWPTTAPTAKSETQSEWMSDDLMNPNKEANDSMFNEPWNEGLSDFHYGGGQFEEAEYLRD